MATSWGTNAVIVKRVCCSIFNFVIISTYSVVFLTDCLTLVVCRSLQTIYNVLCHVSYQSVNIMFVGKTSSSGISSHAIECCDG